MMYNNNLSSIPQPVLVLQPKMFRSHPFRTALYSSAHMGKEPRILCTSERPNLGSAEPFGRICSVRVRGSGLVKVVTELFGKSSIALYGSVLEH